jgi:DNA modification methylase
MTWVLYEGDCLEIMPTMADKCFNLIVIDPPYNKGKDTWDKIPNYLNFMGRVFKECERLLRDNGSFYFFHDDFLTIVELQKWIEQNTAFIFKQLITWLKIDPRFRNYGFAQQRLSNGTARNYYNGFTEYCLFYTFQDETGLEVVTEQHIKPQHPFAKYLREEFARAGVSNKEIAALFPSKTGGLTGCVSNWLNGDNVITEEQYTIIRDYLNRNSGNYLRREYEYLRREYEDLRREYEDLRYTFNITHVKTNFYGNSNVWKYPPAPYIGHLTPKPIPLIENIILHSSNPGDLILDCFAGGGTTAIAAENCGRNSILIEKEPKYCEIIRKRMSNRQMTLFEAGVTV